jgi:pyruvate/2-oxoglutarate dehydrogenase complex dihydrolipoamide dehydrogenase (E3) component
VKVIVNIADSDRVVGFHILSPNAGEITQGIAVAIKLGLTKQNLDETVGIHPTVAEVIIYFNISYKMLGIYFFDNDN